MIYIIASRDKTTNVGTMAMASYAFMVPVLPGLEERNRAFAAELQGPRKAEYLASRERAGIDVDRVGMQETPAGTVSIVYLEAAPTSSARSERWRPRRIRLTSGGDNTS